MKLAALMRKEFHRFFHDPRLIMTLLMPGLFIFLLYSVLGEVIHETEPAKYDYKVYLSGQSQIVSILENTVIGTGSSIEFLEVSSSEEAIDAVEKGEANAYLIFSENFDASFDAGATVDIYYTSSDVDEGTGESFYALANSVLQTCGMRFSIVPHSFLTQESLGKMIMKSVLPMLVVTFIFSACMSVTLESVAGEKERGTLTTILATSVRRSDIALGKILPLCCIASLGAASSFLGIAFSLPKMMGISFSVFFQSYGFVSYLLLFLSIMGLVPLIVSMISTVSAFSRSVKEASAFTSVVMILMMVLSLITSFVSNVGDWAVVVPVFNSVFVMEEILAGGAPVLLTLAAFGLNLVYSALLVLLISRMLSSEKIMFGK